LCLLFEPVDQTPAPIIGSSDLENEQMTIVEFVRTIARAETSSANNDSLSGIVIFCGIGLLLSLAALIFGWLGDPAAVMF
jgi:hypothetical protein